MASPQRTHPTARPEVRTEPVLAVIVCHDGEPWLPTVLAALRAASPAPRHVVAVETGSTDGTWSMLADAAEGPDRVIDGVLALPRDTGFGAAVAAAVEHARTRWGDPGAWLWLLHDDSAPEPDCLGALLGVADIAPSAAVFGPLALDWSDPSRLAEAGLSTDSSGHRHSLGAQADLDWARYSARDSSLAQDTEVLAVPSAGCLIRLPVWDELGGYDADVPLLRDDLDFGWRANRAGHLVLFVPAARVRHAQAVGRGMRTAHAAAGLGRPAEVVARRRPRSPSSVRIAADRAYGLRTYLVNCSLLAFMIGVPRVLVLCLLRTLGFLLLRRPTEAHAELRALGYLGSGRARLYAARAARRNPGRERAASLRGLLITRRDRLRGALGGLGHLIIRRRVRADAEHGRLTADLVRPEPAESAAGDERTARRTPRAVGPQALPAGAVAKGAARLGVGLRRPKNTLVVPLEPAALGAESTDHRPSPRPRDGSAVPGVDPELVLVNIRLGQVLRELFRDPPTLLVAVLVLLAIGVNIHRLGLDLSGGRLQPVGDLGSVWREYLASWHPVHGGTLASAPPALAVLGLLGGPLFLIGGPKAVAALLLLADLPLAGMTAYWASSRLRISRRVRAFAAAGYALLPMATAAVAQGRLDAVLVHVLAPPVLAGIAGLVRPVVGRRRGEWLPRSVRVALGLAVIGAFSPAAALVLVVVLLGGFVLHPPKSAGLRGRTLAVIIAVLLPIGLLLPWPAVLWQHPAILLHGVGRTESAAPVAPWQWLLGIPGGSGGAWWAAIALVIAAVLVCVLGARRPALPGLGVALLGLLAAALVGTLRAVPVAGGVAVPGWTGPLLLVTACGVLWAVLTVFESPGWWASRRFARRRTATPGPGPRRTCVLVAVALLAVMAAGALLVGSGGPLRRGDSLTLAAPLAAELPRTDGGVLIVDAPAQAGAAVPSDQVAGRLPAFGDDVIAPAAGQLAWRDGVLHDLGNSDASTVRGAVAELAADGISLLVLPDQATADQVRSLAGDVLGDAPPTADGRPVLRVEVPHAPAMLLSPQLGHDARTGGSPPAEPGALGVTRIDVQLPYVAVRTSAGIDGRLLVLATESEPGWHATLAGRPAPVATAWGHQLAVPVPPTAADVRVDPPNSLRGLWLIAQAAAILFALVTAVPTPRRRDGFR